MPLAGFVSDSLVSVVNGIIALFIGGVFSGFIMTSFLPLVMFQLASYFYANSYRND